MDDLQRLQGASNGAPSSFLGRAMEELRLHHDREGNTLSVWFDDPEKEHVCEESDDDVILVKDRRGQVIGFERLNFLSASDQKKGTSTPVEVQMA